MVVRCVCLFVKIEVFMMSGLLIMCLIVKWLLLIDGLMCLIVIWLVVSVVDSMVCLCVVFVCVVMGGVCYVCSSVYVLGVSVNGLSVVGGCVCVLFCVMMCVKLFGMLGRIVVGLMVVGVLRLGFNVISNVVLLWLSNGLVLCSSVVVGVLGVFSCMILLCVVVMGVVWCYVFVLVSVFDRLKWVCLNVVW